MKKLLSVMLCIIMTLSILTVPISALAADSEQTGISALAVDYDVTMPTLGVANSTTSKYKGQTYYSAGKQLYNKVKEKLCDRVYDIDIYYYSSKSVTKPIDFITDILVNAGSDELSTSAVDGDYVFWQIAGFNYDYTASKYNGYYYYLFEVEMFYNDTKSQELQVDRVVDSFVNSIDFSKLSDYQIIEKVYDFICSKAEYDYNAASAMNGYIENYRYAFSAYGALVKGKCVCQGYALAFYRLCKELGYNVRFVSSDPNEGCHAWNIIMLDGKYYFVDCTWDDENGTYDYFLVDYDGIRKNDTSFSLFGASKEHTLDPDYYDTEYFIQNYKNNFATGDYDYDNVNAISSCVVYVPNTKYTYTGSAIKPSVIVKTRNGKTLTQSVDYKQSFGSNTATGVASTTVSGVNDYYGSSKRTFNIAPTKVTGITASSRTTTSITLKWNVSKDSVDGYKIYRYKNGSWVQDKNVSASSNSATVSSLAVGSAYKFKMRAYKTVGDINIYSDFSSIFVACTMPKSTSIKTIGTKSKSITITWAKVSCTGYQIQYSTSKDMKNAKVITASASSTSKKIQSLTKGKRYYIRIRPYKKYKKTNGKTYYSYGGYSAKKSIIVK